ncbi:MAG: dephospho-CoA kinase [Oscillospiraceae bacterium]|nr:dephospho-CoA kinase [Oscillospiraceae bacterium]
MIIVGLTGQSGAGKTTVCETFKKNGFAVINADIVAREVMSKGSECLDETVSVFGDILLEDGTLDRKKLAEIVFSDSDKLSIYENIIFPYIIASIRDKIGVYKREKYDYLLLDAPTLFESKANKLCDIIVSVIADRKIRLERILKRDLITLCEAESRLNSQKNDEFYVAKSDYVIKNNGSLSELENNTMNVVNSIKEQSDEEK